jgi:hypothetical protein
LHGLAGDIVRAIEPHSEADPAALLIQTLVGFGNIIGRTAHFVAEADRHYLNLFAVVVGASSHGRKGSSWGHIKRLLDGVESDWSRCIVGGLSSGEGLIHHVRDGEGTLKKYKRALVLESEFASVLRVQKRLSNTLSATLRQAWDTGDLSVMRRNSPDKATGAHISIIGHITADELRDCLQKTDALNGYANRFLWVFAQRSKKLPEGGYFHQADTTPFVRRLAEAAKSARVVGEMRRDAEAAELWREIYDRLDEETDSNIAPILSRAEAQIMRLACVYALLDCSAVVRRVHLEAAHALWRYCEASVVCIFGDAPNDRVSSKIMDALIEAGEAGLTQTEINYLFKGRVKAIWRVLRDMQAQGLVSPATEQTAGRWATRWRAADRAECGEGGNKGEKDTSSTVGNPAKAA